MSWYMYQKSWNEGNVHTVCIQMALKQQRSWHAFKWCCEIVKLWIYERWRRLAVKWEKTSGGAFCIPAFEAVSCKGGAGLSISILQPRNQRKTGRKRWHGRLLSGKWKFRRSQKFLANAWSPLVAVFIVKCVFWLYKVPCFEEKKTLTAYKTDCDNPSKSIKADESQSIPR